MNNEDSINKKERMGILNEVLEYGDNIISQVPEFRKFSVACMDHIGEKSLPYIKSVYEAIRYLVPKYISDNMDSPDYVNSISSENILDWYHTFIEETAQKKLEKEFKDNIDELQFLVEEYRNTKDFKEMLEFIGRFKWLAPYNAMLVQMQLPGARLVLNGKTWANYNRRPKKNARRLITLMNFGPIQCMFEYADTEHIPGTIEIEEEKIFEKWDKMLMNTSGNPQEDEFNNLIYNLGQLGIYVDTGFEAVNTYGGYLSHFSHGEVIFHISDSVIGKTNSAFIISINSKANKASQFHTLCHELGHLFCRHLYYDRSKERHLTIEQREFEAETVAWLVCKRRGIHNPSEAYLSTYASSGNIPVCSTDIILKAVTKIESLLTTRIKIKDSPWYDKNKPLQTLVQRIESENKRPRNLFNYQ